MIRCLGIAGFFLGGLMAGGQAPAAPLFENRSAQLPEHIYRGGWEHFVGGGVALFDCNLDGLPDIFAAGGSTPASLLVNQGAFAFEPAPLPELTGVVGAYPLDMDSDGQMDLFVLRVGPNVVLRGTGGCAFENTTAAWGLPDQDDWSTAFTAWWDGDWPTLVVGNYVDRKDPEGPFEACADNVLLRPVSGRYQAEPLMPGFCALSALAAQDARGRPSLRISNDRHYYVSGGYEQMWDIQQARFLGPEDGWDRLSLWGMGIASRDVTGDGRDEVMLTSMGDQHLQIAQADGRYRAAPYALGTTAHRPHTGGDGRPSTGWHAEFGDVDNDARADLFIAKGNVDQMPGMATRDPNTLLMQQKDGSFAEAAFAAGVASMARSRGAGMADFDGDGALDLIVVNRRKPLEMYRNVTPKTGHWVQIALRQPAPNIHAIGAVVDVRSGDRSQRLQKTIGGGHAGGQSLPLHVGLGGQKSGSVRVTWPDGTLSDHPFEANQKITLVKP